jgi:hypothetical protein
MVIRLLLSVCFLAAGCNVDISDGKAFTGGSAQRKPWGPSAAVSSDATAKPAVKGRYQLRVSLSDKPLSNAQVLTNATTAQILQNGNICMGEVNLHIMSDFSLKFPQSKAKCILIGDLDLEKLLGGMGNDKKGAIESDGKVLRLEKLGPVTFSPARPLLMGPIAQDMSIFEGYSEVKNYSAVFKDPSSGEEKNGSGTIGIRVLEAGSQMNPILMPGTNFDSILHFQLDVSGFKGLPKSKGFLFDKVNFWLNSRPIAIPRILIQSRASDLLDSAPKPDAGEPGTGGSGGGVFGATQSPLVKAISSIVTLYIHLDAISFESY